MSKLRKEVHSAFTSEEQTTPQRVNELPFLLACLAETSRVYPTGRSDQPVVVPQDGAAIYGMQVLGGV